MQRPLEPAHAAVCSIRVRQEVLDDVACGLAREVAHQGLEVLVALRVRRRVDVELELVPGRGHAAGTTRRGAKWVWDRSEAKAEDAAAAGRRSVLREVRIVTCFSAHAAVGGGRRAAMVRKAANIHSHSTRDRIGHLCRSRRPCELGWA